jgi:hypothetical protein
MTRFVRKSPTTYHLPPTKAQETRPRPEKKTGLFVVFTLCGFCFKTHFRGPGFGRRPPHFFFHIPPRRRGPLAPPPPPPPSRASPPPPPGAVLPRQGGRPATRPVSAHNLAAVCSISPHWEIAWGIAERYDPQIIGASFRMPVATARTFVRQPEDGSLKPRLHTSTASPSECKDGNCKEMKCKYCDEVGLRWRSPAHHQARRQVPLLPIARHRLG